MDVQEMSAVIFVATLCTEKKVKKRAKRTWMKSWVGRCGQYGLYRLQRELEKEDSFGFRKMLRMDHEEFNILLGTVEPLIAKQNTKMRRAITARERLSLTLRFLATGESYKSLSFQYRMGACTISRTVTETTEALHQELKEEYLKTPKTEKEWQTIAASFQQKWQFPNCLGALDGKHIFIQPPANSGSTFHNYKGRFSVLMMAVVDASYKFLYVSVGAQGRIADAGLFAHSDFRQALDQGLLHIPPPQPLPNSEVFVPFMFIGDDAYPLRADLMKPYSHRHTERQERIFNYRLSRARRVVENAFGILANRWRLFRTTIPLHPNNVGKITLAAVCLHNFLSEGHSEAYTPPGTG
ncbi:uncharacterized protein [Pseudorasbora parva]|uniref:uncharacterized protein n=1 Tax=Pseudorasbora parva TaxID=51549 RepID=UPI00351E8F16